MTATPITDRRQRRRQETIEEVLDVAAQVMREQGVAGLSIGEVARRMGIRPPSLYVYFDSKNALYDGLFARGWSLVLEEMERVSDGLVERSETLYDAMLVVAERFVRWSVEHPEYSQLLFWRPVPGFEPSTEAYAPAVRVVELSKQRFTELRDRGLLRDDVPLDVIQRDWTVVTAGVISQQLANAPHEPFAKGSFTTAIPRVVEMFTNHYAPPTSNRRSKTARGNRHADER
jgi:AcrR family transcriptional regulator